MDIAISLATSLASSVSNPQVSYNYEYDFETISSNPLEITDAESRAILSNYRDMRSALTVHIKGVLNGHSFDYKNPFGLPLDDDLNGWKSYNPVVEGKLMKLSSDLETGKWYLAFDN